MPYELTEFLRSVEQALGDEPRAGDLRAIREKLDSAKLEENLKAVFRQTNDPEVTGPIRDLLMRCQRKAEEMAELRSDDQDTARRLGVSVGGGLAGAGVLALIASTNPITLIAIGGGVFMAWRARSQSSVFSEEIVILGQISGRLKELVQLHGKDR